MESGGERTRYEQGAGHTPRKRRRVRVYRQIANPHPPTAAWRPISAHPGLTTSPIERTGSFQTPPAAGHRSASCNNSNNPLPPPSFPTARSTFKKMRRLRINPHPAPQPTHLRAFTLRAFCPPTFHGSSFCFVPPQERALCNNRNNWLPCLRPSLVSASLPPSNSLAVLIPRMNSFPAIRSPLTQ